jgi:hypothetical protein
MNNFFSTINWRLILGGIIIFELLAFLSFFFPSLNGLIIIIVFLASFIIAFRSLEWGILLILIELIIGSHGHLFSLSIFGFSLSIRMVLWSSVMLNYLFKLIKKKIKIKLPFLNYYIFLAIFVFLALINALLLKNDFSSLYSDFNSWLFFLLIFPISYVYLKADQSKLLRLRNVFFLAVFWLSIKTLFLVFFFSHNFTFLPDMYRWLRDSRIAEITSLANSWPRIFIQSQIYSAVAFLLLVFKRDFVSKWNSFELFLSALFLSTVIISFSRSFWLALFLVFIITTVYSLIKTKKWQKIKLSIKKLIIIILLSFSFIYLANNILFFSSSSQFSLRDIRERVKYQEDEAALASRWSLLPVLVDEIIKKPLIGHGFGHLVTYQSFDPRVLKIDSSGWHETYAFEWGYLDLWLKLGAFGLLAYLWLLFSLLIQSYKKRSLYFFTPIILFLMIVHFFTPYLNHPLGISIILFISCLLGRDKL